MPYEAEISRTQPGCFIFLIDQSGSMGDSIGGDSEVARKKADVVADSINRYLSELSIKCAKDDGVRDYFDVAVIGYGEKVGPAFGGALSGREIVPISDVASSPVEVQERSRKVDDGAGGLVDQKTKFPIWFYPSHANGTPMNQALARVRQLANEWMAQHPDSFPPIIINFTDAESGDGDPSSEMQAITEIEGRDGAVLLFNCHISHDNSPSVLFPDDENGLPNDLARMMYRGSSPLPPKLLDAARAEGLEVGETARGFAFNADTVTLIQFLDIGTRTDHLR